MGRSKVKAYLEKKFVKYLAFTIYWPQRENMTSQYIFSEKVKKSRIAQSYFLLLSFRLVFMRPQTFEFFKKYVFFQEKKIIKHRSIYIPKC